MNSSSDSSSSSSSDHWVTIAFVDQYVQDQAAGELRSLAAYQEQFPGFEAHIAREFEALSHDTNPEDSVCLTLPETLSVSAVPQSLGPYRIHEELGRGGQAVVWRATDTRLGREVALKILTLPFGVGHTAAADRLRREASATSRIEHPHICAIYDVGEEGGRVYIAMQCVEGESLSTRLTAAKEEQRSQESSTPLWTIEQTLKFFVLAARALHRVHETGVVHRDVKPGNLMVNEADEPVVLDFGLARDLHSNSAADLTLTGELVGTPAYLSPEQVTAKRIVLDRRTDVWSLGVALFETLTLRRPFEAALRTDLYQAIMTKEPVDPRSLRSDVSKDLRAVLLTALEKDRDRRYVSAEAFAKDMERVLGGRPVEARPSGPARRLMRTLGRHPMAVCGLVLLLAGLSFALIFSQRALRATQEARDAAEESARLDAQRATLFQKSLFQLSTSLHSELDHVGRSMRTRRRFAETLRESTEKLIEHSDDPSLKLRLATAHLLIGDTMGAGWVANDGDYEGALAEYERSREIVESLPDSVHVSGTWSHALAKADLRIVQVLVKLKRFDEATELCERMLKLADQLGDEPVRMDLSAGVKEHMGIMARSLGRKGEALKLFQEVLELRVRLMKLLPKDSVRQANVAEMGLKVSRLHLQQGSLDEAETVARDVLHRAERLRSRDNSSPLFLDKVADAWWILGLVHRGRGDADLSFVALRMSTWIRERLLASVPGEPALAKGVRKQLGYLIEHAKKTQDTELHHELYYEAIVQAAENPSADAERLLTAASELEKIPFANQEELELRQLSWLRRAILLGPDDLPSLALQLARLCSKLGLNLDAREYARMGLDAVGDDELRPSLVKRLKSFIE